VNVLGAGKSGAATFFVSPTSKDYKEATRFVKMDDWLKIQKEYASYQQIIRPKLNNHIARIIQKPSVSLQANDSANHFPSAGIVSSLAGFPENYEKLDSLEGVIRKHIDEENGAAEIIKRINSTLELVLLPLHQPLKTKKYNLLAEFPCIYTGTLVNLLPAVANGEDVDGDYEGISLGEYVGRVITLKNWTFNRIDGNVVTLTHPKTQATIKLRSQSVPDITKRFNTLWLKSGMLVNVNAIVDAANQDIKERFYNPKAWKICSQPDDFPAKLVELIDRWNNVNEQKLDREKHIFYYFQGDNAFSIKPQNGKFGVIHGDLNLNNILYAENEIIGFLIDFANAKSEGLVAFDIAWLETQIWNNFLFPNIVELARRSPSGRTEHAEEICFLLNLAIESINNTNYPDRLFSAQISGTRTDDPLMICILNTLKVTSSARKLMTKKLGIPFKHGDINYALAVSFLRHTRFNIGANTAQSSEWIGNQSFLCANYYLNKYINDIELANPRSIE
jgi:Ternary complex associated domain 9